MGFVVKLGKTTESAAPVSASTTPFPVGRLSSEDGLGVLGLADSPHVVVTLGYPSDLAGDGVPSWWI